MTTTQLRLPGQAAAPEGPVDMFMMYLMHHAFRRDLAAFAGAVPRTPVEDRAAWQAMKRRWDLFSDALHHHHEGEDTWLWPALLERADQEGQATLEAMEAEHGEIDPLLESCGSGLASLAEGGPDADVRAALAVRLCAAKESLGRHLAHEENDAIRLIQELLSSEEWDAIEKRFSDDITFGQVLSLVPWVLHEVPDATRNALFAKTGSTHRVIWQLTHRRFERLERQAFGAA